MFTEHLLSCLIWLPVAGGALALAVGGDEHAAAHTQAVCQSDRLRALPARPIGLHAGGGGEVLARATDWSQLRTQLRLVPDTGGGPRPGNNAHFWNQSEIDWNFLRPREISEVALLEETRNDESAVDGQRKALRFRQLAQGFQIGDASGRIAYRFYKKQTGFWSDRLFPQA